MINTTHLLKVMAAWTSTVYAICFIGVALFPGIRSGFMQYALHTTVDVGENVLTLATFVTGLVIWNGIALLAAGLFAVLFNRIKA